MLNAGHLDINKSCGVGGGMIDLKLLGYRHW